MNEGRERRAHRVASILTRVVLYALLLAAPGSAVATTTEAGEPGRDQVAEKLAEFGARDGDIIRVVDAATARIFPSHAFYAARFRQYPVAVVPPTPLRANNLFAVEPDGTVERLPDTAALEAFFRATAASIRTARDAEDAVRAWLRLTQEFHQDGFFHFSVREGSVRAMPTVAGGLQATGTVDVTPEAGNAGAIGVSLTFDRAGRLVSAVETASVKRGIRPICQATKLLDPDPVVRRMAEDALLVMGALAGDYLAEQRAMADDRLRDAIDRIWQRILANGRK
jgi:hypothetical protein